MKQLFMIVLTAFVFLSSTCKKEMQLPDPELKKIFGKWQWVSTSGGFTGKTITPASEGYTVRIEFSSNGIYQKYQNNALTDRKNFSFSQGTSIHNHKPVWVISFTEAVPHFNESPQAMSVSFSGQDTLMLDEQAYDGYGYIYVRIK
jgi:hypothetical protein